MVPGLHQRTPQQEWDVVRIRLTEEQLAAVTNLQLPVKPTDSQLVHAQECYYRVVTNLSDKSTEERELCSLFLRIWPRERRQAAFGHRLKCQPRSNLVSQAADLLQKLKSATSTTPVAAG